MTAQAQISSQALSSRALSSRAQARHSGTTVAARPAADILIEKVALKLLAWSESRAKRNQLTHERMALVLENQRTANRGGSSLGR
ncbi:MAG TPA: hypothetical protein VHU90_11120 [Galbitalea sp.]|nr:hypothetical protein [Galbitalea sp.]